MTFSPVNKIKAALLLVVMTLSSLAPAANFMTWWSTEENLKTAELLKDKAGNAPKLPFFQNGKKGMATGVTLASAALVVVLTTMVQAGVNGFVGDATTKDLPRSFGTKLKNALSAAFTPAQLKQVGLWSLVKSIKKDPTREDLATFGQRLGAWLKGNKTFLALTVAEVAGACMLAKGEFNRHTAWKQHETDRNELLKLIAELELTKDATLAQLQEAAAEWNSFNTDEFKDCGFVGTTRSARRQEVNEWNELKKSEARGVDAKTLPERRHQKEVLDRLSAEGARLLSLDFTKATVQEILAARAADATLRPLAATFGGTATDTLTQLKEKQATYKAKQSVLQALFVEGFVSPETSMDELTRLEKMVQQVQTLTLEQMKPLHGNTIKKLLEIALQMKASPENIANLQRQALLKDLEDEKRRAAADAYVNPQPKIQKPTPHHEIILPGREQQLTFDLSHLGFRGPDGKITLVTLPISEVGRMLNGSSTLNAQTQAILMRELALQMQGAQTLPATSTALTLTSGFSFEQQTAILKALQHRLAELERQAALAHKHQAAQSKWQDLGRSLLVRGQLAASKPLREDKATLEDIRRALTSIHSANDVATALARISDRENQFTREATQLLTDRLGEINSALDAQIQEQKAEILADAAHYPAGKDVTIGGRTLWVVNTASGGRGFSQLPPSPVGEDDRHLEDGSFSPVVDPEERQLIPTATPAGFGGLPPLPASSDLRSPVPRNPHALGSPLPVPQFRTPDAVSTPGSILSPETRSTPMGSPEKFYVKTAGGEIAEKTTGATYPSLPSGWAKGSYCIISTDGTANTLYKKESKGAKGWKLVPAADWAWTAAELEPQEDEEA